MRGKLEADVIKYSDVHSTREYTGKLVSSGIPSISIIDVSNNVEATWPRENSQ